jgi:hypothetical protein
MASSGHTRAKAICHTLQLARHCHDRMWPGSSCTPGPNQLNRPRRAGPPQDWAGPWDYLERTRPYLMFEATLCAADIIGQLLVPITKTPGQRWDASATAGRAGATASTPGSLGLDGGARGGAAVAAPTQLDLPRRAGTAQRHLPHRADHTDDSGAAPGVCAGRRPRRWRPVRHQHRPRRRCCFSEKDASVTVDCARSDSEHQLSERSREPMPRVYVSGQFVVAAANILDQGVADADHPY